MKKKNGKVRIKLTPVSTLHYIKLVYRSALLLIALAIYIRSWFFQDPSVTDMLQRMPIITYVIWVVFVVEMLIRFFPNKLESPGCQKQFERNYIKTGNTEIKIQDNNATLLVALVWICFNMIFGFLHMGGILDDSIMLLIACTYSVCDMICILFYCPFQSIFLKNKCCSTCRIYNWDYAMMFTPLFFVSGIYAKSLFVLSIVLLARWEITIFFHPERFAESTNEYLYCKNCTEKLCTHKRHLIYYRKKLEKFTSERIQKLKK